MRRRNQLSSRGVVAFGGAECDLALRIVEAAVEEAPPAIEHADDVTGFSGDLLHVGAVDPWVSPSCANSAPVGDDGLLRILSQCV